MHSETCHSCFRFTILLPWLSFLQVSHASACMCVMNILYHWCVVRYCNSPYMLTQAITSEITSVIIVSAMYVSYWHALGSKFAVVFILKWLQSTKSRHTINTILSSKMWQNQMLAYLWQNRILAYLWQNQILADLSCNSDLQIINTAQDWDRRAITALTLSTELNGRLKTGFQWLDESSSLDWMIRGAISRLWFKGMALSVEQFLAVEWSPFSPQSRRLATRGVGCPDGRFLGLVIINLSPCWQNM